MSYLSNTERVCKVIALFLSESRITRRARIARIIDLEIQGCMCYSNIKMDGVERSTIKDECATKISQSNRMRYKETQSNRDIGHYLMTEILPITFSLSDSIT